MPEGNVGALGGGVGCALDLENAPADRVRQMGIRGRDQRRAARFARASVGFHFRIWFACPSNTAKKLK